MVEYCCSKFESFYKKHDLVSKHKNNFYYMILYSDISNVLYVLKYCPFCGKDLTPGLEVLFEK